MIDKKDYNDLKIAYVVGYMLKVLKNKLQGGKYKQEFASIRHGNYNEFIELMNVGLPEMVIYSNGEIKGKPFEWTTSNYIIVNDIMKNQEKMDDLYVCKKLKF